MLGQPSFQFPFSSSVLAVCFFTPENLLAGLPNDLKSWQQWERLGGLIASHQTLKSNFLLIVGRLTRIVWVKLILGASFWLHFVAL
jgi:hypothetical protein